MYDDTIPNLSPLPDPEPGDQKNASEIEPQSTESQSAVQQQPEPPKEHSEERNFRNLREKSERIQRERDEAFIRLKQYEDAQRIAQQQEQSESDALKLGP